eukprot:TRINITY_DN15674_c0_g1_i3.p1 TRINITY_DN15674_c0_g1~~TRINITY_DN15674_c0_g1_i3.p1  ORF type:complete len:635 (+),score=156.09 TRINITY_DN15674_c0_g1_i3:113-2017(+)
MCIRDRYQRRVRESRSDIMNGASAEHSVPPVTVFVRVRPLLHSETSGSLDGLALESSPTDTPGATAFDAPSRSIGGFTGVLGQESDNTDVFERSFASRLDTVVRGGTASLFCYGYTGSGKTHTVIGYGQERGMYALSAERLLGRLRELPACGSGEDQLFLRATACEVYGDAVFDLLGAEKLECTLRVDEAGQLIVAGAQESTPLDPSEAGVLVEAGVPVKAAHATLITRASPLRSIAVREGSELDAVSDTCVQQRAVGSSTTHQQSSRSHAIMKIEVVNQAVIDAQTALDDAKAAIPARKNALDNVRTGAFSVLYTGAHRSMLADGPAFNWDVGGLLEYEGLPERAWEVSGNGQMDPSGEKTYTLHGHDEARTVEQWAKELSAPELALTAGFDKRVYEDPERWDQRRTELREQQTKLTALVHHAQVEVDRAAADLAAVMARGSPALGGTMLLVDLAGADYDHRSGAQQKESAAINKSLLALKECFRSLANVSGQRAKFRDSKLTRLLEDALAPTAASTRINRESVSVMLVNVSPDAQLEKMTLNTLRYGQMYADANTNPTKKRTVKKAAGAPKGSRAAAPGAVCAPEVRAELLEIYENHCPEKTREQVESILSKFGGRETELLEKARAKYLQSK